MLARLGQRGFPGNHQSRFEALSTVFNDLTFAGFYVYLSRVIMDSAATRRPPVGVVIVNHNFKDSLRETLESFRKVNYPGLQVVVSDNASTDGSQEMVQKEFPEVHLLAHNPEKGYAKAAGLGLEFLADKTKYIFSTTNDVIVDPEIINVLVDHAETHPKAGVLGTKIYFFDRRNVIWHAGGRVNPIHGHTYH